jgi:hypothetical protein
LIDRVAPNPLKRGSTIKDIPIESDQQSTRKLAELKSFLEKNIKQHEEELTSLRSYLELVDTLLADRSFRKIEIPAAEIDRVKAKSIILQSTANSIPVMTNDGVRIASIVVDHSSLQITPEANMQLDVDSPPLRSFLVGKVLESMCMKDKEAAASGSIQPEAILRYDITQVDGKLMTIHIENYGDERRLLELKNAIRWTFRRMYEKANAKPL